MKIVCQSCNAAFNVDDAKIPKGKKVGVKCKSCGAVIVILPDGGVQGGSAGGADAVSAPPAAAPAPKAVSKAAPAPAADDPFGGGGGDDPFAGFSEDKLEVEGASEAPPEPEMGFEPEAPPEPSFDEPEAPPAPPPKKVPKPVVAGAGAANDPFAEDAAEPDGGPSFAGATEFGSSDDGAKDADGNFSFDDGAPSGGDSGGGDLDELDAIDRQVETETKTVKRAGPAAGSATVGLDADAFFDPAAISAGQYVIKNSKGQTAGPFAIDKVKELLKSKKISAKDEISRNEGPWLSVKLLIETNVDNTDLEKFLATASAEAAGGGFSFDEATMGQSGLGGGRLAGNISVIIKVAVGLVLIAALGAGGWWWWASREVELSQLSTPKLRELVASRQGVTSSREELSKQAYQKAESVIRALLVEQFPEAEKNLKIAIQKNPSNFQAAAMLARTYALWAEMLGDRSKLPDAQGIADVVKTVDPSADHSLVALAHVSRVSGKTDEAIATAQNAITIAPNSVDAQTAYADALLGKPDRIADAQAAIEKALALGGEDQLALLVEARIKEIQKDFPAAAEAYDKAIAARQNAVFPRLLKARFILAHQPDKVSDAIDLLKAAESVQLDSVKPFKARLLATRTSVLLAGGQTAEALAKAKEADTTFPSAETKTAVGDGLFAGGQVSEALISYEAAVAADANYQPAHQRLGKAHIAIGENDKGEASLKRAVELDPGDLTGRVLLGQAFAKANKLEEAQKEYEAVIGIDPKNADAYVSLGQLQLIQGKSQDALGSFNTAIELDPQNPDTFIAIGKTYWELGDSTNAIERTRKAVELAPLRLVIHQQLARFLWDTGDFTGSISSYDQAIQLIKEGDQNYALYLERGIVKYFTGDYDGAQADIAKAYEIRKSEPQVYYWNGKTKLTKARALIAQGKPDKSPEVSALLDAAQSEFSKAEFYARQSPQIANMWGETWMELKQYASSLQQLDSAIAKGKDVEAKGWLEFLDPQLTKARLFMKQEKFRDAHNQYGDVLPKLEKEEELISNSKKFMLVPDSAPLAEQMMDWHPRRWPKWEENRLKMLFDARVETLSTMGFIEKDEMDKPQDADAILAKVLALKPDLAKAHLYRCGIAMDKSQYKDALPRCQQAIKYDPNLGEAYRQIGYIYMYDRNDPQGGIQYWFKSLKKGAGLSEKLRKDVVGEIRNQGTEDGEIRRKLRGLGYDDGEIDAMGVRR